MRGTPQCQQVQPLHLSRKVHKACPSQPRVRASQTVVLGSILSQRCNVLDIVRGWEPSAPPTSLVPNQAPGLPTPWACQLQTAPSIKTDSSRFRSGFYKNIEQGRGYAGCRISRSQNCFSESESIGVCVDSFPGLGFWLNYDFFPFLFFFFFLPSRLI